MSHTPLPWTFEELEGNVFAINSEGKHWKAIGQTEANHLGQSPIDRDEAKCNAELVVRACNSFYALRGLLDRAQELLSYLDSKPGIRNDSLLRTNLRQSIDKVLESLTR